VSLHAKTDHHEGGTHESHPGGSGRRRRGNHRAQRGDLPRHGDARPAAQQRSGRGGQRLGDRLGIPIAPREEQPDELQDKARNRQTALGALSGFAMGLTVGTLYGLLRSRRPELPLSLVSLLAGVGAMAFSDVPLTVSGLTDPREWGASGWASDLLPHLAYGACTALVFDALAD
jgi:hypothetical protein